jgi:hypothetical protein
MNQGFNPARIITPKSLNPVHVDSRRSSIPEQRQHGGVDHLGAAVRARAWREQLADWPARRRLQGMLFLSSMVLVRERFNLTVLLIEHQMKVVMDVC